MPTIIPHYTLAPMSTSSHATLAALQLLIDLDSDPRYAGKEIILMGDSAGGWFVGQLLATLTKLALGEKIGLVGEDEIERVEVVERIRGRMKKAILISPALEMDMGSTEHPEDEEIQADVCRGSLSLPRPKLIRADEGAFYSTGLVAQLQDLAHLRSTLGTRSSACHSFRLLRLS